MSVNRSGPIESMPATLMRAAGVAVVLLFASVAYGADETAPVQKPDVKVGDLWRYRVLIHQSNVPKSMTVDSRISFLGPDLIVAVEAANEGQETDSQFDTEWNIHSLGYTGQVFDPPARFFKFPLQVGAEYSYAYGSVQRGSPVRSKLEGNVKVVGWEDIAVPAGKFRALKIQAKGIFQRLDANTRGWNQFTFWYVPEVKRFAKATIESSSVGPSQLDLVRTTELVEFKVR